MLLLSDFIGFPSTRLERVNKPSGHGRGKLGKIAELYETHNDKKGVNTLKEKLT